MAERPWVTPQEVKKYTDYAQIQKRDDAKLKVDISRAEQYVIAYTNNTFSEYDAIPEPVKTAVILLAEAYAYNACSDARTGGKKMKSESFDDYSYTADDSAFSIESLNIKSLLDPFVKSKAKNGVIMRMRKL